MLACSVSSVKKCQEEGKICVLDIDMQVRITHSSRGPNSPKNWCLFDFSRCFCRIAVGSTFLLAIPSPYLTPLPPSLSLQGVRSIKKTEMSALYVHVKPPSMEVLEKRLRDRKTDTEEAIQKRLATAKGELEDGEGGQMVCGSDDPYWVQTYLWCLTNHTQRA